MSSFLHNFHGIVPRIQEKNGVTQEKQCVKSSRDKIPSVRAVDDDNFGMQKAANWYCRVSQTATYITHGLSSTSD